jgi:hypothetical protein
MSTSEQELFSKLKTGCPKLIFGKLEKLHGFAILCLDLAALWRWSVKVGDLVKWSNVNVIWHRLHLPSACDELENMRQRGIIVDRNPRYFFVFWENGDHIANCPVDLEVVSEGR